MLSEGIELGIVQLYFSRLPSVSLLRWMIRITCKIQDGLMMDLFFFNSWLFYYCVKFCITNRWPSYCSLHLLDYVWFLNDIDLCTLPLQVLFYCESWPFTFILQLAIKIQEKNVDTNWFYCGNLSTSVELMGELEELISGTS